MAFLFFTLSGVFLFLTLHPFVTYPLTLPLIRRFRSCAIASGPDVQESIALCICAYNEEAVIADKIANLLALKRTMPALEIYIYVDGSTDRTAQILAPYSHEMHVSISSQRRGKTYGMNRLAAQATSSILLFTDANVILETEALRLLPQYFSDPKVGCVCGHLRYTNAGQSSTAANGSLYWRLEERIKQLESDTGSVMGADGSVFAIRRTLHRPPPDDIIDDMYVSLTILCDGYRIVRAPDIVAWEQSATSAKEEFARKIRISCQAFNAHRLLWKRLRQLDALNLYKYISHKFIRWFTLYWLALAIVFLEAGMAAAGLARSGILLALFAGVFLIGGTYLAFTPVLRLADILGAFLATGLGVLRSLQGVRYQTWAPSASARSKKS